MAAFENFAEEARRIEREIERHGVLLGIDWQDEHAVRALAREALACRADNPSMNEMLNAPGQRAKLELFGLAQLMLKVMTEGAGADIEVHGGPAWKAFARALWRESGLG
jgi:hypothetical protein